MIQEMHSTTSRASVCRHLVGVVIPVVRGFFFYLRQRRRYTVYVFARVRLSVCLFVCVQDYSKRRAWIWMKCCVSTDVGTWTNWLTFEPDPDYSPHAGTGLLSPISYALQRGILLRRENSTYMYWAAATRGFTMVFFTASRWNNFVGGTCALPSVLLVWPIDLCM